MEKQSQLHSDWCHVKIIAPSLDEEVLVERILKDHVTIHQPSQVIYVVYSAVY